MYWKSDFNKLFEQTLLPENFIKNFKDEEEFKKWLDLGSNEDLIATLKVFEDAEMYKICAIIQKYLKDNKDE